MQLSRLFLITLTFTLFALCAGTVPLAQAATFIVDRSDDDASATVCDDATPNDCSLRGAIIKANGLSEASTINVPAGTYVLTQSTNCTFQTTQNGTNLLSTTALCLASNITLSGAGAASTIIGNQVGGINGVIAPVMLVGSNAPVEIRGVTITKGNFSAGSLFGQGGGINNAGTLTLLDDVISGNQSGNGGGIFNSGSLTVRHSTVEGNFATTSDGAGILNAEQSTLTVNDSTIRNNIAHLNGGGVENFAGTVIITNSTVSGNEGALGGGIANFSSNFIGKIVITNSTISGNRSGSLGGGIYNHSNTESHLSNVTIANNTSGNGGGGVMNNDGGILTLRNTLIAGNTAASFGPDCFGFASRASALLSQGYNLIQNPANCDLRGDLTGNILGQNPQLGLLTDNGGPTQTHALGENSPAVDAGSPDAPGSGGTACAATDQRGLFRPVGTRCDIGAVERSGAFSVARILPGTGGNTGSVSALVSGSGFVRGATVKLRRAGQAEIVGNPLHVDVGGSAIAVTFNLAGQSLGPWDVVVMNPDGSSKTLVGGFTIEQGRAPDLWVDVSGAVMRHPSRFTIVYRNRGNVDALAVPLTFSSSGGYGLSISFGIAPPPPQAGQIRTNWSQVPIIVQADAQQSFVNVPLLLPVVPAGFTGALQIVLTLPPGAVESTFFANLGSPYFHPALDAQVVSSFVQGAQAYASQGLGVAISPALVPDLERYVTNQLQLVVSNGRNDLVTNLGTTPQVYSVAQLQADAAIFGAVRTLANSQASAAPPAAPTWLAAAYHAVVSFLSWLEPIEAQAITTGGDTTDCSGLVLPEGASCGALGLVYGPPPIPPPPGCDPNEVKEKLKDATGTAKFLLSPPDCRITTEQCEAVKGLGYTEIHFTDGSSICAATNCGKTYTTPSGKTVTPKCQVLPVNPKNAVDPNAKAGSLGVSAAQFLVNKSPLSYTIHFENLETATAPAQIVKVTDPLALQNLDLDTFSLGPITLGHITLLPAPGLSRFTGGIDLRPAQNLIVTVNASLDESTGVLTWLFTSINPDTGQLTDDPDAGFLPPNVNPPEGEGSVVFTVQSKAGLATGTTICNQASIVFDVNAPIPTPQWCNSVDSAPPSSHVLPLAANQTSASFTVEWAGTDVGAGIQDYTIFVSENGGPFTPFVSDTTDSSATFTGQVGHNYAFYSIARDLVGNEENPKATPDARTIVGGLDQCPDDPNKTEPGACGCGVPDSEAGQPCTTGQPGVCSVGVKVCSVGTLSCQQNQQSSAEVCDGLDNNCNGTVDEGFNAGAACSVGVGACQRTGTQVCTANGLGTQCSATPGTPSAEICGNGIDDDCDGVVDNGCPSSPPGDACLITTVLDTFNRADGSVGTNWRGATNTAFYRIAANRLDVQVGGPIFWNPTAFGANQAAFVTLSSVDTKGPSQGVLLKVQGGTVPDAGAIAVVYDAAAKAVRVSTLRLGTLSWTSYGNMAVPFTNGDKLGACAKANGEVRVYKNNALVKTITLSAADQGFFNAKGGKVGIWSLLAPQAFMDDFGGATIGP